MATSGAESSRPIRLLSLDGGGIRGLSSLLMLKYLMKLINPGNPPKPCEYFDLIGGTSTGGLIAVMLGRLELTVDECIEEYLGTSEEAFSRRRSKFNILGRAKDKWDVAGVYSTDGLEKRVKQIVAEKEGDEKAELLAPNKACKIFVCAYTRTLKSKVQIRTYANPEAVEYNSLSKCQIWQAVRATAAASSFFDPIKIGNQEYIDGGTGMNNPVEYVLAEARSVWKDADRRIQCILSIGTGKAELKGFGDNANEVIETLVAIATDTEEAHHRFNNAVKYYGLDGRYFRFDVDRGLGNVELDDHEKVGMIEAATERYLEDTDVQNLIKAFVKASPIVEKPIVDRSTYQGILTTLPSAYPQALNDHFAKKHTAGTGTWFLEEELNLWMTAAKSFVMIFAGSGKSTLCAKIVAETERQLPTDHVCVHFYFSFRRKESQDLRALLQTLVKQLAQGLIGPSPKSPRHWLVPQVLIDFYEKYQWGQAPSLDALKKLFEDLVGATKGTYLILDALDECLRIDERLEIVQYLSEYLARTEFQVRLLVTSRPEPDIRMAYKDLGSKSWKVACQELSIKDEYVRHDVRIHLDKWLATPAKLNHWSKSTQDLISITLTDKAKGNFRYVECQLDELLSKVREKDVRVTLESLPKNLDETYDRILDKIKKNGYEAEALCMLMWLVYSANTLTASQLAEVAAFELKADPIESVTKRIENFNVASRFSEPPESTVLRVLSNFCTTLDNGEVALTHFSVLEYLRSKRCDPFFRITELRSQLVILESSLKYNLACSADCATNENLTTVKEQYPLAIYTTKFWGKHAKRCFDLHSESERVLGIVRSFLDIIRPNWNHFVSITAALSSHRIVSTFEYNEEYVSQAIVLVWEDLHHILESFASEADKENLLGLSSEFHDYPPLVMAAEMGHQECVKALLKLGASPDAVQREIRATALHYAALRNLTGATSALLEAGSSDCSIDREQRTALHWACLSDSVEVVRMLLAHVSDFCVAAKDMYGFTALHLAVKAALWNEEIKGWYVDSVTSPSFQKWGLDYLLDGVDKNCEPTEPIKMIIPFFDRQANLNSANYAGRCILKDSQELSAVGLSLLLEGKGADIWDQDEFFDVVFGFSPYVKPWVYGQWSMSIWRYYLREFWALDNSRTPFASMRTFRISSNVSKISTMCVGSDFDIMAGSFYKALDAFIRTQCTVLAGALQQSSSENLLDHYSLCWKRFEHFVYHCNGTCYSFHKWYAFDKQAQENATHIWFVKGLLFYHWKIHVLDAEPRLIDAMVEYLQSVHEDSKSETKSSLRRYELQESLKCALNWIYYADADRHMDSPFLPKGAQTIQGDFIPIDWAENDPKWSAVLDVTKDFELPLKSAGE